MSLVASLGEAPAFDAGDQDASWKTPSYVNLVETSILVRLGTIEFVVISSYGISLSLADGQQAKFYDFCESVGQMEF